MKESLQILDNIGFDRIKNHEIKVRNRLLEGLKSIPGVINYGDMIDYNDRLGIGVFNIADMDDHEVAQI